MDGLIAASNTIFPHLNAGLNLLAAILLVSGYVMIKRGQESKHKVLMMSCFVVSVVFLASYVYYHTVVMDGLSKRFPRESFPIAYWVYLPILGTHVILAALVPFLAATTIYLGLRDRRVAHKRVARWTFPIWLYVSITGVVVYVMLYWMFVPPEAAAN